MCVSKSSGLAYSWKEIYVSNLQEVFPETRLEVVHISKTQPCKCFVWGCPISLALNGYYGQPVLSLFL